MGEFLSVYYKVGQLIMSVENGLLSRRRTKEKMFSWKSFIVSSLCCYIRTLMLSLGKLMKMCGIFISCESLTNRNLIAPFFAVLDFFLPGSEKKLTTTSVSSWLVRAKFTIYRFFLLSRLSFPQWLRNRKWRINIWDDQIQPTTDALHLQAQFTSQFTLPIMPEQYENETFPWCRLMGWNMRFSPT